MRGWFNIANPDAIECDLTLRMTLSEWKVLAKQLPEQWPSHRLSSMISDLVSRAEKEFQKRDDEVKPL
jgi:hypothetical protein